LSCDGERIAVAHRRFATHSRLACYGAETGALRWQQDVHAPIQSLTFAGDVYLRSTSVYAFSGDTGKPLWTAPVSGCSPLALARGKLFAVEGRDSPLVLALDPRTGRRMWSRRVGSSCSGLVVAGSMGYVSTHDGSLYALNVGSRG